MRTANSRTFSGNCFCHRPDFINLAGKNLVNQILNCRFRQSSKGKDQKKENYEKAESAKWIAFQVNIVRDESMLCSLTSSNARLTFVFPVTWNTFCLPWKFIFSDIRSAPVWDSTRCEFVGQYFLKVIVKLFHYLG